MAKRFTDTGLYDKDWFLRLPPRLKCAWEFLRARCDELGVWDISMRKLSFEVGEEVTLEELQKHFKVQMIEEDKLWIPTFVAFQYGDAAGRLSRRNKFHLSIAAKLHALGLPEPLWKKDGDPTDGGGDGDGHPIDTLSIGVGSPQGKGKGEGKGNSSLKEGAGENFSAPPPPPGYTVQAHPAAATFRRMLSASESTDHDEGLKQAPPGVIPELAGDYTPEALALLERVPHAAQRAWLKSYPDAAWIRQEVHACVAYRATTPDRHPHRSPGARIGTWLKIGWQKRAQGPPSLAIVKKGPNLNAITGFEE